MPATAPILSSTRATAAAFRAPEKGALLAPGPDEIILPGQNGFDDPIHFLMNLMERYGDIARFQTPYNTTYLVSHPEIIFHVLRDVNFPRGALLKSVLGEGLLSGEGADWQRHRKIMVPDFHPRVVAHHGHIICRAVRELSRRWLEYSRSGQTINAADEMMNLTLGVVIESLFSGQFQDKTEMLHAIVKTLLKDIGGFVRSECGIRLEISPQRNRVFQQCLSDVNAMIYEAINVRRRDCEAGHYRHDLLDLLVETCDGEGRHLADQEIRDEVVTMLFAGSETTAVMLGWSLFSVCAHDNVETLLHEELSGVLQGRLPGAADTLQLSYLNLVLDETMRMYPPVWAIFRKVKEDDLLAGFEVKAGQTIIVSPYTIHHNPKFWPEPERFDPFRHTHENGRERPKYAYIPFGGGRHVCIGKHLSLLEARIVISTLAQNFTWQVAPGHEVGWDPLVTLRLRDGLPIQLQAREGAAQRFADGA